MVPDPKTWVDTVPKFRVEGVVKTSVVWDLRGVQGPVSYPTGGFPVDLSAEFAEIHEVIIFRGKVAPGAVSGHRYTLREDGGTYTLEQRKFLILAELPTQTITPAGSIAAGGAHSHLYDRANATVGAVQGQPGGVTVEAAAARTSSETLPSHPATDTSVVAGNAEALQVAPGGAGVAQNETHKHQTPVLTHSQHDHAFAKIYEHNHPVSHTPTATDTAGSHGHAFAGTTRPAGVFEEETPGVNLSGVTVMMIVIGVPA